MANTERREGAGLMNPAELRTLADRIETEMPSDDLREAIGRALGWKHVYSAILRRRLWKDPGNCFHDFLPAWLNSIDAAVGVIPDDLCWIVTKGRARTNDPLYYVHIFGIMAQTPEPEYSEHAGTMPHSSASDRGAGCVS